jgi:crotonobetainyl-CoA:carnitine CoA-transferase CaiB-like acyl-CoA transferase
MNLDDLKREFDQALAKLTDQDIVNAFAEMGCTVEIVNDPYDWVEYEQIIHSFTSRAAIETYTSCVSEEMIAAADSNELALAA